MNAGCPWTERELSIVRFLSLGMTVKEIARESGSSVSAVAHHVNLLRLKARTEMGRSVSSTGVVALALRNGWIE